MMGHSKEKPSSPIKISRIKILVHLHH